MTARELKLSRLREAAVLDIDEALNYYFTEAPHMVRGLENAVLEARRHVEKFPGTGSKRYQSSSGEDVLRFWTLNKFPCAIFYFERADYIEIVRLLHQSSNIPVHLES
jgi:toxin ParE1/3/4